VDSHVFDRIELSTILEVKRTGCWLVRLISHLCDCWW